MIKLRITIILNYLPSLKDSKQSFDKFIYSLTIVKLEILKIYIKVNFKNRFSKSSKFFISTLILFVKKFNSLLLLSINYQYFNNLI